MFLLSAVCIALAYWLLAPLVLPAAGADDIVLFRPNGDPAYFGDVTALSRLRFGEISIAELSGSGLRSVPLVPIAIYGLIAGIFGDVGFAVSDALIVVAFAVSFAYLMRIIGVRRRIAEAVSLVVICGVFTTVMFRLKRFGWQDVPFTFWHSRFPRPLVSEVLVVLLLILAARLVTSDDPRRRWKAFLLAGLSWAALLQSDVYQAANLLVPLVLTIAYAAWRWGRSAAASIAVALLAAVMGSVPFAIQRYTEGQDVARRWGLMELGHHWFFLSSPLLIVCAATVAAISLMSIRTASNETHAASNQVLSILIPATVFGSIFVGSLTILTTGKGIQLDHFPDTTKLFVGYAALVTIATLSESWARRADGWFARLDRRMRHGVANTLFLLVCALCTAYAGISAIRRIRSEAPTANIGGLYSDFHNYQSDFRELTHQLRKPEWAGRRVLATFDEQLGDWWLYRGGFLYLAQMTNTTVTDNEIETRVFDLMRILHVTSEEFDQIMDEWYFLAETLSGAKYQANSRFTPWPLTDYSPDARERIAHTPLTSSWQLELPLPERERLIRDYEATTAGDHSRRLDVIVLAKDRLRRFVHPEKAALSLAWSNGTFELWIPRDCKHAPCGSRMVSP